VTKPEAHLQLLMEPRRGSRGQRGWPRPGGPCP
jgi:hypothetical protein